MGELSSKFACVHLIVLFVCANGNVMMNYEMSNSNHVPVAATYSGMRDRGYSRNYQYPPPDKYGDDLPSSSNNNWSGGRQLSSLAATSLQSAASSDYLYGATANDNYAAANGHGPGSHMSGGGGGGSGHGKDGCNSALGLLGVLGLASYLQNVLRQMTTTAAPVVVPPGRRRRGVHSSINGSTHSTTSKTPSLTKDIDDLTNKLVPLLTAVGHARDGLIPVRCTRRQVCLANHLLSKELEVQGKSIGIVLSTSIGKMLKEVDKTGTVVNEIAIAAKAGRNGKNCEKLYDSCPALSKLPIYTMPSAMDF